ASGAAGVRRALGSAEPARATGTRRRPCDRRAGQRQISGVEDAAALAAGAPVAAGGRRVARTAWGIATVAAATGLTADDARADERDRAAVEDCAAVLPVRPGGAPRACRPIGSVTAVDSEVTDRR